MGLPHDGASVGRFVRKTVGILKRSGWKYEVHAMGSKIEAAGLEQIFEVVRTMDEALGLLGTERVTIWLTLAHR
ncbi:MAG TPA: thiamine-binding protein [Candidatus Thermoplasmatota archaeon]